MSLIAKPPPLQLFRLGKSQWTQPFWDAAASRRLVAPRCGSCGRFRLPPTPFCPHCQSQTLEWPELSGTGIIYSFTIVRRAILPEMEDSIPYAPAVIELPDAGGVRLVSNIVQSPIDSIHVGKPVTVEWQDGPDGIVLPLFRLAERGGAILGK
jgi:uncharacterized OB-fold protein